MVLLLFQGVSGCVNDELLLKYLSSFKANIKASPIRPLFSKIEYAFDGRDKFIVYVDFSLPNIMPDIFFKWMFLKGLRKKGYKVYLRSLNPKDYLIKLYGWN